MICQKVSQLAVPVCSVKMGFRKLAVMFMAIVLLLPPMAGCGDDDEATPTAFDTSSDTVTPTVSKEPVKIGAISSWSGPTGLSGVYYADQVIELLEKQVNEAGGVLGGRPIEFVKCDNCEEGVCF